MSVDDIALVNKESGRHFEPPLESYDIRSERWEEREIPLLPRCHRAGSRRLLGRRARHRRAGGAEPVIRLGTFSKVLAPGVRVGWMMAPRKIIRQLIGGGLRMSGGGPSHFAAMAVAEFMAANRFEPHLEHLRTSYCGRRDELSATLDDLIPEAQHQRPAGGYFVWVRLPRSFDTEELLPISSVPARGV